MGFVGEWDLKITWDLRVPSPRHYWRGGESDLGTPRCSVENGTSNGSTLAWVEG